MRKKEKMKVKKKQQKIKEERKSDRKKRKTENQQLYMKTCNIISILLASLL